MANKTNLSNISISQNTIDRLQNPLKNINAPLEEWVKIATINEFKPKKNMEIRISDIEFETTELLETISVNDQTYACEGYNEKGHKYEGIAHVSCGEIVKVTDVTIA